MAAKRFALKGAVAAAAIVLAIATGMPAAAKNEGVTRLVLPAHVEEVLSLGANISPLQRAHNYVAIEDGHEFNFQQLLADAELVHAKLAPIMRSLYFRIFRLNLDAPCRLRERNDFCSNSGTGGDHTFETDANGTVAPECIPKCYVGRCQPHEVASDPAFDGLEHFVLRYDGTKQTHWDPKGMYCSSHWYKDILGFYPEGEQKPVYVDLLRNPPSHTGYQGGDDWKNIYELQCSNDEYVPCEQTEHLYRLISGMQSSVAIWSAWNYKCVNPVAAYHHKSELPKYAHNPSFYAKMVGDHEDRLENLYYTFQAMLRAVCRLTPFLTGFANNLGQQKGHEHLQRSLIELLGADYELCRGVDHAYNRRQPEEACHHERANDTPQVKHPALVEKFNSIADIVDCLGCEKCRLHGKLKITALQIVVRAFGQAEELMLERNEIIALLHALDYFAQSVIFVNKFSEQQKRQFVLYPLRAMVAALLVLVVAFRHELVQAMCHCTIVEGDEDDGESDADSK